MLKLFAGSVHARPSAWTGPGLMRTLGYGAAAAMGFLLSRAVIMGELYPFGISFLAAIVLSQPALSRITLLAVVAGMFLAVKGTVLLSYLAGIGLVYAVLYRYQKKENHWLTIPALVLAINLLCRGVFTYLNGNDIYLWVGVIFESFFAGVLTLVSITGLQALPNLLRGARLTAEERTSLGIILMGALVGVAGAQVGGLSVQSILSRLFVLGGSLLAGPGGGAAIGVAVGMIPSVQGSLSTGPIAFYALAGLLGGIFNSFGRIGVVVGFTLGNLLLSLFFSEQLVIVQSLWETGIAILLFLLLSLVRLRDSLPRFVVNLNQKPDIHTVVMDRLKKVSQVFAELEKVFRLTAVKREIPELNSLFNKVAEQVCEGCSLRKVCWEQDFYKTYRALLEVCSKLESLGSVSERDFSSDLKRRCMRLRELNLTLNSQLELLRVQAGYQRQLDNCTKLINNQLSGLSQLILDFAEELRTETMCDSELAGYLKNKLWEKGIQIKQIDVAIRPDGEKELTVYQDVCLEKNWCKAMIAPNVSQMLGKTYIAGSQTCSGKGCCSYHLVPSPAFRVLVGKAQCPKEGGQVSGDVGAVLELADHRLLLLISDGMGAGEEALEESRTAINLLERLLFSGFTLDTALKTINAALFLRTGQEKFATLDIAVVNRINGQADFIKLGGAPSLICSPKGIRIVKGASPPAGILENIEAKSLRHNLSPGNLLIMMSDGVWEAIDNAGGPAGWLEEVINSMDFSDPQKVASYLLFLAKKATGNKARDDMCIQVAWLSEEEIA